MSHFSTSNAKSFGIFFLQSVILKFISFFTPSRFTSNLKPQTPPFRTSVFSYFIISASGCAFPPHGLLSKLSFSTSYIKSQISPVLISASRYFTSNLKPQTPPFRTSSSSLCFFFFFISSFSFASVDSLSLKIDHCSELIAQKIEQSEKTGQKSYLLSLSDPVSSSAWIEERGGQNTVLTSAEFNQLTTDLENFNAGSSTGVKLYAVVINDFKIYFNHSIVDIDSIDRFELNNINVQWLNQKKLNELNRLKEEINGKISSSVLKKLNDRGIGTDHLCIYTYARVRGYGIKNDTEARQKNFYLDQLRYPPSVFPYRDIIRQRVNESCVNTGKRAYHVIEGLIYALTTLDAVQSIACGDDHQARLEKTALLRNQYFESDIEKLSGIVALSPAQKMTGGYCENLINHSVTYAGGYTNFATAIPTADKKFYIYEWADKVSLLEEHSDHRLFCLFSPLTYIVPDDSLQLMAEEIYSRAGLSANDILLFLPYFEHTCAFNSILFPVQNHYRNFFPLVITSDASFQTDLSAALHAPPSLHEKMNYVFSKIPKEHHSFYYFINMQGDVVSTTQEEVEMNARGYSSVFDFYFLQDDRKNLLEENPEYNTLPVTSLTQSMVNGQWPWKEYFHLKDEFLSQFLLQHPQPEWKEIHHNLRETKITQYNCLQYAQKYVRDEIGSIPSHWFKDGFNQVAHEDYLQTLDGISLAASVVGLDFLVDGYAMAYCESVGDNTNATIYATFLAVPVGTGGEARIAKGLAEGETYVYKSMRSSELMFRKKADDIFQYTMHELPEEVQEHLALPVCRNIDGEVIQRIMSHKDDPQFTAFSRHLEEVLPDNDLFKNHLRQHPSTIDDYFENYFKQGKSVLEFLEGAGEEIVRGVSRVDFLNSVPEFASNNELFEQAYYLWKTENWSGLENLFNQHNINYGWPPNDGFIDVEVVTMEIGMEIDRYGGRYVDNVFSDNGTFVSPLGASFESRALPENYLTTKPYKKYRVVKEIPNVKKGKSIPWFGQVGMGVQYKFPDVYRIDYLKTNGYIEEVI
ncbi:MAG: TNT domain-containing protein [Bacteroidota bacterium]